MAIASLRAKMAVFVCTCAESSFSSSEIRPTLHTHVTKLTFSTFPVDFLRQKLVLTWYKYSIYLTMLCTNGIIT